MGRTSTIAAVVAAAMMAIAGCSTSPPPPELSMLDLPATAADALPAGIEVSEDLDTIRYVGESGGALIYSARGVTDEPWCVLVVLPQIPEDELDWVAGSSCADDDQFARRGVWTSVGGGGRHGAALLLPDNFSGEVDDGWQIVKPNLALRLEA